MTLRTPLAWPEGWPRTQAGDRQQWPSGPREMRLDMALAELLAELRLAGARDVLVTACLELRADGMPYARQRATDPGVAVRCTLRGNPRALACDRWTTPLGNLRALAKTIEALRGIERWGSATLTERTWQELRALPAARPALIGGQAA